MIEPEPVPATVAGLLARGYSATDVQGIVGHNNLRVARRVWK